MVSRCPLCYETGTTFFKNKKQHFYLCGTCKGIFADKKFHLNTVEEKVRYKHHKNNIRDHGYIKFVNPIISTVQNEFNTKQKGLDFGVGHTPVISEVLKAAGYQVEIYDPLFFNNNEALEFKYNFVTCCEVVEHFYNPKKEFELLHKLLIPKGKLICMTLIYHDEINFEKWFYKNDPTHVFLYQKETIIWIKDYFNFIDVKIDNRLITFTR
jgi:hypothetical protein